ncbi:MAG TPA: PH domain-containing protein, partial [Anaerolineae bacterium]|nr:PH domain-containing protein [Anaerolineae bacterium]
MSINEMRAAVTAKVWREIANSGIDVSAVDRTDMDKLVGLVVDAALAEVDAQLGSSNAVRMANSAPAKWQNSDEQILWEGRPFLSLVTDYIITNQRVRIIEGLLGKNYEDIELVRVQDVDFKQSISERAMNLGDIFIRSHDPSNPEVILRNVQNPKD